MALILPNSIFYETTSVKLNLTTFYGKIFVIALLWDNFRKIKFEHTYETILVNKTRKTVRQTSISQTGSYKTINHNKGKDMTSSLTTWWTVHLTRVKSSPLLLFPHHLLLLTLFQRFRKVPLIRKTQLIQFYEILPLRVKNIYS